MNRQIKCFAILPLVGAAIFSLLTVSSSAQDSAREAPGKFQIIEKDDGIVRLDKSSGETSFCRKVNSNLVCNMAVEERAVFQKEIAALQQQIAELENAGGSKMGDQLTDNAPKRPKGNIPGSKSEEELDRQFNKLDKELGRALDLTKRTVRRFFDAVKEMQRDWKES